MKNFKVALTADKGSTITDGTYNFQDNAVKDGHGIYLAGTVKGTNKNKLKITANDKCDAIFYGPDVTFENATINVKSQTPAWTEAYDLTLKNSSLTVAGFGGSDGSGLAYYVNKLNMDNSEFVINKNGNGGHRTGLTIQGAATINSSRIVDNAGDHAGISVCPNAKLDVINSTLEFNNNGEVGLNIHSGKVTLTNSAITGSTRTLYKAKDGGSIEPDSNSSIGESASKNEEASNPPAPNPPAPDPHAPNPPAPDPHAPNPPAPNPHAPNPPAPDPHAPNPPAPNPPAPNPPAPNPSAPDSDEYLNSNGSGDSVSNTVSDSSTSAPGSQAPALDDNIDFSEMLDLADFDVDALGDLSDFGNINVGDFVGTDSVDNSGDAGVPSGVDDLNIDDFDLSDFDFADLLDYLGDLDLDDLAPADVADADSSVPAVPVGVVSR